VNVPTTHTHAEVVDNEKVPATVCVAAQGAAAPISGGSMELEELEVAPLDDATLLLATLDELALDDATLLLAMLEELEVAPLDDATLLLATLDELAPMLLAELVSIRASCVPSTDGTSDAVSADAVSTAASPLSISVDCSTPKICAHPETASAPDNQRTFRIRSSLRTQCRCPPNSQTRSSPALRGSMAQ
jgi:hypothetical protein